MSDYLEVAKRLRSDFDPDDLNLLLDDAADALEQAHIECAAQCHDIERHIAIASTEATRAEEAIKILCEVCERLELGIEAPDQFEPGWSIEDRKLCAAARAFIAGAVEKI